MLKLQFVSHTCTHCGPIFEIARKLWVCLFDCVVMENNPSSDFAFFITNSYLDFSKKTHPSEFQVEFHAQSLYMYRMNPEAMSAISVK